MLKHWISAFRLRTLPLALSTILMGNALALNQPNFSNRIFLLSIVVTILLQILSNLANDYGDGVKGTDNDQRVGPKRAVQSGVISQQQMKVAIIIFSLLSLGFGLWLVFTALSNPILVGIFIVLGLGAIAAAIKYTVGKKAYGYSGLGDLFVFLFFGLVGVLGTYYLQTESFSFYNVLPAITVGAFSTAVLNLNNMRDIENDKASGKNTLVVKMGLTQAKKYHAGLFLYAYLAIFIFIYLLPETFPKLYLAIATLGILGVHAKHLLAVKNAKSYQAFDPHLKVVALSSFLLSLAWFFLIKLI